MQVSDRRLEILEQIEMQELEEVVLLDDLDDAILGLVQLQMNGPTVLAYSVRKIMDCLMKDGMDEEEALEYMDFNIIGLYAGPGTPVFVQDL